MDVPVNPVWEKNLLGIVGGLRQDEDLNFGMAILPCSCLVCTLQGLGIVEIKVIQGRRIDGVSVRLVLSSGGRSHTDNSLIFVVSRLLFTSDRNRAGVLLVVEVVLGVIIVITSIIEDD